jgi:large subunit ribosomal protein L31e
MGYSQDSGQIQIDSQEKAMANKEDKGLGGKGLTEQENKEEEQETEEAQEEITETVEETPEKEAEKGVTPEEAEPKEEEKQAPSEKEEVKPSLRKKKTEEEEIVEERIYTVPLGKAWIMPPRKRTPRAMRMIRAFVIKHMKLEAKKEEEEEEEPRKLVISNEVNEKVWERGVEKPPRKIRIRAAKDKEGNITVYLAEGD